MNKSHIAFALVAWTLLLVACSDDAPVTRTRVVLITLDTLRYDRFAPGDRRPSAMPLTWAHAERGLVFDRFYTVSGVTQPAHATLFSGRAFWEHGITRNGVVLPEDLPNITERMQQAGFETHGVVASFPLTRRFGYDRGFDHFTEDFSHNLSRGKALWEGHWKIEEGAFFAMADAITEHANGAIDNATSGRQFFWFHYFDPHAPYGASSGGEVVRKRDILKAMPEGEAAVEAQLARARARYDADVATLDRALDRLLIRLQEDQDRYQTHIVLVADHGESLGEGHSVGHGARLHEAELRVPAFVLSPRVEPGRTNALASMLDLAPTILSLAGVETEGADPTSEPNDGRDLTRQGPTPTVAYAVRRTSREKGQSERRLDGSKVPFDGYQFAAIEPSGAIYIGSAEGFLAGETEVPEATHGQAWLDAFDRFENALRGFEQTGPLSPEVRRGLEALGYVE
ncbi:MAG: sulfatase [Myxococcota bacterium]|jgi:arylsulfatase A-like enzyme|nr:sulfatase [Myxococcota bacterium]